MAGGITNNLGIYGVGFSPNQTLQYQASSTNVATNPLEKNIYYSGNCYPYSNPNWGTVDYLKAQEGLSNCSYIKLGNKIIHGKEYQTYRLQNGTIVNIRQDQNATYNTITTKIKNATYNPYNPNNNFKNMTESHLFEHMFVDFSLNNGYYQDIDDGNSEDCIRFIVKSNEDESLKNIVDKQAGHIYSADFSQEVFDREKRALNYELYWKQNVGINAGKRNEINDIDLNRLRQIRNNLVIPSNIEIMVEGNVNPQKVISEISQTNANIKSSQIKRLPDINFDKIKLYEGNEVKKIELIQQIEKPKGFDDKKMMASLIILKFLALFSDKTNLSLNVRQYTYGVNIVSEQNELGKFIFGYSDETFKENAEKLEQKFKENLKNLKTANFTKKDITDAKKSLKLNFEMFYGNYTYGFSNREELFNYIDNISPEELKKVINNLNG